MAAMVKHSSRVASSVAMLPYYYGLMSMLSSNAMTHGANANGVKVKGKKKSRDQEKKTVESLDNLTAVTTATSTTSTPYDSTGKLEMEQKEVKLLQLFRKVSMYGLDDLGHIFDFQRWETKHAYIMFKYVQMFQVGSGSIQGQQLSLL